MPSCILAIGFAHMVQFFCIWNAGIGWDVLFMLSWIRGRSKRVWVVGILQDGPESEHIGYLTYA